MLKIIRLTLFAIWVVIAATLGTLRALFKPFDTKSLMLTANLIKHGDKILGLNIIVRNREILLRERPCVFISNHQDNLDIILGSKMIAERIVTIGKRSILFIPFFGIFYWLSGNILINRGNKRSAFGTMDTASRSIKEKNLSIWIMPEGTRSRGRGLLPFKKGPFVTAIKAQVPIVPVAWSNYIQTMDLNKWRAGVVIEEVLEPIQTAGMTLDDVDRLKDHCYQVLKTAIERIDAEAKVLYEQA
ncbi:1-acyl-sn-glycerol-3-phosphate acyltransferase [Bacteriovorax stolpii]|nr:1-acylglycerol-3-phosphate O-acyltransferase [Bacteriovorax stolpii]TDP52223.1 1-acyl-sn-glycerol-3-phosphate acyltransferase [Bacteriovorax stolpii]